LWRCEGSNAISNIKDCIPGYAYTDTVVNAYIDTYTHASTDLYARSKP